MPGSYFGRLLFDGEKLKERALEEFSAAMRGGRLCAFVGSFATEEIGYPKWEDFLIKYATTAQGFISTTGLETPRSEAAVNAIKQLTASQEDNLPTAMSVIEHALAYASTPDHDLDRKLQDECATWFDLPARHSSENTHPRRIITSLGIRRVITLNYDIEFEWELMTTPEEKKKADQSNNREDMFDAIEKELDPENLIITRTLPSGRSIISDVFRRQRPDRLLEFAVGSPDYEAHILHLHGRKTDPKTMVISQSDYNSQYRRSGVTKLPFEHALRILFAGNPILFVGVGMNENLVTATLEQFVSDNPSRRTAPIFILWNRPPNDDAKEGLRFRWMHRFSALTLFDDEVATGNLASDAQSPQARLGRSIKDLAGSAVSQMRRFEWRGHLRSSDSKLLNPDNQRSGRFDIWSPVKPDDISEDGWEPIAKALQAPTPIHLFIGEPGRGKGAMARRIREAWEKAEKAEESPLRRSSIINASFVFEIDSVFGLISGLDNLKSAKQEKESRRRSLLNYINKKRHEVDLLLVINGMERFFAPDGVPLSAELDSLFRMLLLNLNNHEKKVNKQSSETLRSPYKIVILGTDRVRRYFESYDNEYLISFEDDLVRRYMKRPDPGHDRSHFFDKLAFAFEDAGFKKAMLTPAQSGRMMQVAQSGPDSARRAMFATYLQAEALQMAHVDHPDLCLDIMTVMAFVGQPVEDAALIHAPRIRKCLDVISRDWTESDAAFTKALAQLCKLGLIIELRCYEGSPPAWHRYGLHRSVLAELRDRWGVPLSDSQLSAGFNISLFAAQPTDGYTPEQDNHGHLGALVNWLLGAHKDSPLGGYYNIEDPMEKVWTDESRKRIQTAMVPRPRHKDWARAWPHVSACLRAALALIRTYYSTSTLLSIDGSTHGDPSNRDAPLTQHADRLDRLLEGAIANAKARSLAKRRLTTLQTWLGPAPFYGDDLVWLYNERGVVSLAQGGLYEARTALDEALRLNHDQVEFGDRGQNWRRIMLNQVAVDIERGALDRAESRLSRIEESIPWKADRDHSKSPREYVLKRYCRGDVRHTSLDSHIEKEVVLTIGLVLGHRGLCMHLAGQLQAARSSFEAATQILGTIGERRAYAQFQRYLSSLLQGMGEKKEAARARRIALAAAEATRQNDIAYQARIAQAWHSNWAENTEARSSAVREMQDALNYAENNDMYRVRIEAGANLARIKLAGGDSDAALAHAADAMAIATRYGLTLRKITLRIHIGQILIRRGDPISGRALLDKAISSADRINYQRAVELAQSVLDREAYAVS